MSTDTMATTVGWALLHFLWQGALIGAATAAALALLRDARPQLRYLVACAALALCLALPVASVLRAAASGDATTAPAVAVVLPGADAADASRMARDTGAVTGAVNVAPVDDWRTRVQAHLPRAVALWSVVAALLALRMALGLAWVARIGRGRDDTAWQARLDRLAAAMKLPRRVLLQVVDGIDTPMAARVLRPVVLLPSALALRLPVDLVEALLAHELAHVRRHDYLVNLLQRMVEALLFYHPVVWWLSARIRDEREQIADALAAEAIGDPRRLARALAELERPHDILPSNDLALAANGGSLMNRITTLVRPRHPRADWKFALPLLALAVGCVSVFAQPIAAPAQGDGVVASVIAGGQATPAATPVAATPATPSTPATAPTPTVTAAPATAPTPTASPAPAAAPAPEATPMPATAPAPADTPAAIAAADEAAARGAGLAPGDRFSADSVEVIKNDDGEAVSLAMRGQVQDGAQPGLSYSGTVHMGTSQPEGDQYALVDRDRRATHYVSASLEDLRTLDTLRARIDGEFLWLHRDGRDYVITDPALLARVRSEWAPLQPLTTRMESLGDEMQVHGDRMEALSARMVDATDGQAAAAAEIEAMVERAAELFEEHEREERKLASQVAQQRAAEHRGNQAEAALAGQRSRQLLRRVREIEAEHEALRKRIEEQGREMERRAAPSEAIGRGMEVAGKPMETIGAQMETLGAQIERESDRADAATRRLIDQAAREGKLRPVESIATR